MERKIKMSLETAKMLYKACKDRKSDVHAINTALLLENFTKEELEGKKVFTWEDSFQPGYSIKEAEVNYPSNLKKIKIDKACNTTAYPWFQNQYRTEKQAISALAFAQLSHIVAKYNENILPDLIQWTVIWFVKEQRLGIKIVDTKETFSHLKFYKQEDAITSLEVNKELWEQYWMV